MSVTGPSGGAAPSAPDERRLKHVRDIKGVLSAEFSKLSGVQGFGIGMNAASDDYAVHVFVHDERTAKKLPHSRDGVEVCVDIVGGVAAAG